MYFRCAPVVCIAKLFCTFQGLNSPSALVSTWKIVAKSGVYQWFERIGTTTCLCWASPKGLLADVHHNQSIVVPSRTCFASVCASTSCMTLNDNEPWGSMVFLQWREDWWTGASTAFSHPDMHSTSNDGCFRKWRCCQTLWTSWLGAAHLLPDFCNSFTEIAKMCLDVTPKP